jgi:hypothetical protein
MALNMRIVKTAIFELLEQYPEHREIIRYLFEDSGSSLAAIGGVRYWSVESLLALEGGLAADQAISSKESWFDKVISLKGQSFIKNSNLFL